jgi:plastocyanin
MSKYLDHTLQVQGTPEKPENKKQIGAALRVQSWKPGGECKLNLSSLSRPSSAWKKSGEPAVPIAGKTGGAAASVPLTSNRSVGETTPPSDYNRNRIPPPPAAQPGQPPNAESIGQTPAAADRMAVAAQRAEIGTHNGTIGVPAHPGSGTVASEQTSVRPAAVVQLQENEYQPAKVTIAVGQAVAWKNQTADPHTVTLIPDKALVAADAALPSNAQPFDSGTISSGMTFVHTFTAPGTYRYFCTLHESNGMVGEVIVK